jgi:hypothetical protein
VGRWEEEAEENEGRGGFKGESNGI